MKYDTRFLISAFPNGFTPEFLSYLKQEKLPDCIVFIPSDASSNKTKYYSDEIIQSFHNIQIAFEEVIILNGHMSVHEVEVAFKKPSLIWIMGGDTLLQASYLHKYHMRALLKQHNGIIIGMSAGAINMADRVVLAKDASDHIPNCMIYEGLGLVNINIEPHLNDHNIEHEQEIIEASTHAQIIGLYDESFIVIKNKHIEIIGPYRVFQNRTI